MESAASRNIPVTFDETQVGSYRLGHASLQMIVGKKPDITVFSTPQRSMGAVMATNEVFMACEDQAFGGHMDGSTCEEELECRLSLEHLYKSQPKRDRCLVNGTTLRRISELERVADVFSFGSIWSIRLARNDGGSSAEDEATDLVRRLRISRYLYNQAVSRGMAAWLEYGTSSPVDRSPKRPFVILRQLVWTLDNDDVPSLIVVEEMADGAFFVTHNSVLANITFQLRVSSDVALT